jgi:hypothetical protein
MVENVTVLLSSTCGVRVHENQEVNSDVVPHHDTISSRVGAKIRINIACSVVTRYCNFYLYWNWFGGVVAWSIVVYASGHEGIAGVGDT